MSEIGKSKDNIYSNRLNLDKLNVFIKSTGEDPMFLEVKGLPNILTYGKHYGTISFKDPSNSPYKLRQFSKLSFEVKDIDGNLIYSNIANSEEIKDNYSGVSVFYIWIKEDPLRTYNTIKNGIGTLTFVGELDGVPQQWRNKPNYKCVFPIEIRTDLPNTSPILFQSSSLIHSNLQLSESIQLDKADSNYKRSYLHISASNLKTYGGKVEFIELAYSEQRSNSDDVTILNTYALNTLSPPNDNVYEVHSASAAGLNPVSDNQKFPLPRQLRRDGTVTFRLRFLNKNLEPAKDLRTNDSFVEVSQSITINGSPLILEKNDNLISGSLVLGKSVNDGVKMVYDKDLERLDFVAGSSTTYGAGAGESKLGSANEKTIFSMKAGDAASGSMDVEGDIRVTGDVIADNYIVSSSVINKVTIDVSGSTNFGNSVDDLHSFTGSLEVSNSAAGGRTLTVVGDVLITGDEHTFNGVTSFNQGANVGGTNGLIVTTNAYVDGFLSGYSGNTDSYINFQTNGKLRFSADGDTDMLVVDGNSDKVDISTPLDITNTSMATDNSGDTGALRVEGGASIAKNISTTNISASGDISASGLLYASASVKTGLSNVVTYDTTTDQFHYTSSAAYAGGGSADNLGNHTATENLDLDSNSITNVGTIDLDNITHTGDTDTKIAFTPDTITMTAGNVEMLKLTEGVADAVTINEGGADVNLRVESVNKTSMLFIDAANDKMRVGASVATEPPSTLTVDGDISASGDFYLKSTKKAYLNANDDTYLDSDSTDRIRFVAGGQQMLVLDYDTGNRAAFGDTKVSIGTWGDNHLPSKALEVSGDISSSGDFSINEITSSGNISASGQLYGNYLNVKTRVKALGSSLEFAGDTLDFVDGNSVNRLFKGTAGGSFEAYYAGQKKLETTAGGISVGTPSITGHITASGNISSSGNLSVTGDLDLDGKSHFQGHITASGNISSSGTTTTEDLIVKDNATIAGDLDIADTIYHTGDSNTKIRFPEADKISFHTSGDEQMVISSDGHITASGKISASGNIEGDAIRSNGAKVARYRTDIDTIRFGRHQTPAMITGSFLRFGDDSGFHVTASGNISSSGTITGNSLVGTLGTAAQTNITSVGTLGSLTVTGDITANGNVVGDGNTNIKNFNGIQDSSGENYIQLGSNLKIDIGDAGGSANSTILSVDDANNKITMTGDAPQVVIGSVTPVSGQELTVVGEVSASSTITSGTGFVGQVQATGSYDFPGAIMGYTNIGANSGHGSYTLTTSMAVPNDNMKVVFVAPKSGKVEITVQVMHYDNNTLTQTVYMGLSDSSTFNSVGGQHEVFVGRQDENGYNLIVNTWGIEGLTPGNTYEYWLGMKMSIGGSGQSIVWGGTSANRNPDFMMKAIALPSNATFV